jgi:hypothetical protein
MDELPGDERLSAENCTHLRLQGMHIPESKSFGLAFSVNSVSIPPRLADLLPVCSQVAPADVYPASRLLLCEHVRSVNGHH